MLFCALGNIRLVPSIPLTTALVIPSQAADWACSMKPCVVTFSSYPCRLTSMFPRDPKRLTP